MDVGEELNDFADVLDGVTEKGEDGHEEDGPNGGNISKANMCIPKRSRITSSTWLTCLH